MIRLLFVLALFFSVVEAYEGSLQVRAATFFPMAQVVKETYQTVIPDFQVEAGLRYANNYELWTNLDWLGVSKHEGSCCKSRCEITQASFGLKYYTHLSDETELYLGVGPSFGKTCLYNQAFDFSEKKSKFAVGAVFKSGLRHYFYSNLFFDFFIDYLYQPVHLRKTVDVGGLKTGLGLGFAF